MGRPDFFAAVVPVAAHYEEDLDELLVRLAPARHVPFWFLHAYNDQSCPHEQMEKLVRLMQSADFAHVHLTSYEDTWSATGHASDFVAYRATPCEDSGRTLAKGNDV